MFRSGENAVGAVSFGVRMSNNLAMQQLNNQPIFFKQINSSRPRRAGNELWAVSKC